jgi:hypothetical protein
VQRQSYVKVDHTKRIEVYSVPIFVAQSYFFPTETHLLVTEVSGDDVMREQLVRKWCR